MLQFPFVLLLQPTGRQTRNKVSSLIINVGGFSFYKFGDLLRCANSKYIIKAEQEGQRLASILLMRL